MLSQITAHRVSCSGKRLFEYYCNSRGWEEEEAFHSRQEQQLISNYWALKAEQEDNIHANNNRASHSASPSPLSSPLCTTTDNMKNQSNPVTGELKHHAEDAREQQGTEKKDEQTIHPSSLTCSSLSSSRVQFVCGSSSAVSLSEFVLSLHVGVVFTCDESTVAGIQKLNQSTSTSYSTRGREQRRPSLPNTPKRKSINGDTESLSTSLTQAHTDNAEMKDPMFTTSSSSSSSTQSMEIDTATINDSPSTAVEYIIARRLAVGSILSNPSYEYLVRWSGASGAADTWEAPHSLSSYKDLITQFDIEHTRKKALRKRLVEEDDNEENAFNPQELAAGRMRKAMLFISDRESGQDDDHHPLRVEDAEVKKRQAARERKKKDSSKFHGGQGETKKGTTRTARCTQRTQREKVLDEKRSINRLTSVIAASSNTPSVSPQQHSSPLRRIPRKAAASITSASLTSTSLMPTAPASSAITSDSVSSSNAEVSVSTHTHAAVRPTTHLESLLSSLPRDSNDEHSAAWSSSPSSSSCNISIDTIDTATGSVPGRSSSRPPPQRVCPAPPSCRLLNLMLPMPLTSYPYLPLACPAAASASSSSFSLSADSLAPSPPTALLILGDACLSLSIRMIRCNQSPLPQPPNSPFFALLFRFPIRYCLPSGNGTDAELIATQPVVEAIKNKTLFLKANVDPRKLIEAFPSQRFNGVMLNIDNHDTDEKQLAEILPPFLKSTLSVMQQSAELQLNLSHPVTKNHFKSFLADIKKAGFAFESQHPMQVKQSVYEPFNALLEQQCLSGSLLYADGVTYLFQRIEDEYEATGILPASVVAETQTTADTLQRIGQVYRAQMMTLEAEAMKAQHRYEQHRQEEYERQQQIYIQQEYIQQQKHYAARAQARRPPPLIQPSWMQINHNREKERETPTAYLKDKQQSATTAAASSSFNSQSSIDGYSSLTVSLSAVDYSYGSPPVSPMFKSYHHHHHRSSVFPFSHSRAASAMMATASTPMSCSNDSIALEANMRDSIDLTGADASTMMLTF